MLLRFILLYGVWITGLKKTRDMSAKKLTFHLQQERLLLAPRRTELFDCPQEQGPRTLRFWPTGLKEKVCCRLFQNFADKKKKIGSSLGWRREVGQIMSSDPHFFSVTSTFTSTLTGSSFCFPSYAFSIINTTMLQSIPTTKNKKTKKTVWKEKTDFLIPPFLLQLLAKTKIVVLYCL